MDKYLLIFNAGYTFTGDAKKLGLHFRVMGLRDVLEYQKQAQQGFLAKNSWKYGELFEADVKKLFEKFKARVIGIAEKDLQKARSEGIKIETQGAEHFVLNPWADRNPEVEKYFPPPAKQTISTTQTPLTANR